MTDSFYLKNEGIYTKYAHANIDFYWGPWTSVNNDQDNTSAFTNIPVGKRIKGLKFGVVNATTGDIEEYMFTKDNATDNDIVKLVLSENRSYDSDVNTKGYVVLKSDRPLDEQIIAANTIYEVRDNYDLRIGEPVDVGELPTQVVVGNYRYHKSTNSIGLSQFNEGDVITALNGCVFLDSENNELGNAIDLPSSEVVYLAKKTLVQCVQVKLVATASCTTTGMRTSDTLEDGMSHYLSSAVHLKEGDVITPGQGEVLYDSSKQ